MFKLIFSYTLDKAAVYHRSDELTLCRPGCSGLLGSELLLRLSTISHGNALAPGHWRGVLD